MVVWLSGLVCSAAHGQSVEDLKRLSIEDITQIEIISVSKRQEPISSAPASIFVITSDDILRSGAISLPEVLRLAPNLDVARTSSQTYAVSARGFNSTDASNKILVLIDGRTVYAPVHSGVYWDQLQVPLDDIERIEVVSGPGGTLYGANAVNGVISIITKSSRETQGGLADLKAGAVDQNGLLRYGGRFGDSGTYRVYGSAFGEGPTFLPNGSSAKDNWHGTQTGFRIDWQTLNDSLLAEGNVYRNVTAQNGYQSGADITGRWTHTFGDGSTLLVQSSYDDQSRVRPGFLDAYSSYDLQAQHTVTIGRNVVVWGGEYRIVNDDLRNTNNAFLLVPERATIGIGDLFAQDTFALLDTLKLTIGMKIENNTLSGTDVLPNLRLGWTVSKNVFLWAAVSRAVRDPSRLDKDLTAPAVLALAPNFRTEKLIAYELGYRGEPTSTTTLSVTLYYMTYDDLRTTSDSTTAGYLFQLVNGGEGNTYGVEAWGDWRPLPWWRLSTGVNLEHKNLHTKPGVTDISHGQSWGYDPAYQLSLRSSVNVTANVTLDAGIKAVSGLSYVPIKNYINNDASIGWQANERLRLSLSGYNLLGPRHAETLTPGNPTFRTGRSIYLGLRWTF